MFNETLPHGDQTFEYEGRTEDIANLPARQSETQQKDSRLLGIHLLREYIVREEYREPRSPHEALNGPEHREWAQAMDEEFRSLENNRTWKLTELPAGRKAVGCQWVFKKKQNTETEKPRYKARFVAQGFSHKYGTDYEKVRAETL